MSFPVFLGIFVGVTLLSASLFFSPNEKMSTRFVTSLIAICSFVLTIILVNNYTTSDVVGVAVGLVVYVAVQAIAWVIALANEVMRL